MTSATLDTNVYVSALEFGGVGQRLLGMARAGILRIDISAEILDELITVLRSDFSWEGYRLHFAKEALARLGNVVIPSRRITLAGDPDDNRILECAVEAGSDFVVTADQHLLRLDAVEGIEIMTPIEFIRRGVER